MAAPKRRPATDADPLGKLIRDYRVSLAGVLVASGAFALVGLVLTGCAYALFRPPGSYIGLAVGAALLLLAACVLVLNVFNIGRRLEVRKHGLRYTEAGVETTLRWEEIVNVAVRRHDETDMGLVTRERESSDYVSPSGPLTKTEWEVEIVGADGATIHLPPTFLRTVGDPKKLIQQIKMRAGGP
jgi:hypothetical protein